MHLCVCVCVPDNAIAAGCSTWSVLAVKPQQLHGWAERPNVCVCMSVRVCVLSDDETRLGCCSGLLTTFQKTQKPCCLHDKPPNTHTDIHTATLIAVSLLQGQKIGYLKAFLSYSFPPTSSFAAFPVFPPSLLLILLHLIPCFLSSCLITLLFSGHIWYSLLPLVCSVCLSFCCISLLPHYLLSSTGRFIEKDARKEGETSEQEDI